MAFPWNRGDSQPQMAPDERRRRSRARRNRQEESTRENTRLAQERRHQRLVWAIGSALVLIVIAVITAGYYEKFYRPPRVQAGSVRNVEFTMGDLVERIRVVQGVEGQVDLSRDPFEYLQNLVNAEILRQASPGLGISITEEDVDRVLRARFLPEATAGDEVISGQLDEEFQQNFSAFLARTGLSESEYLVILEEEIAEFQLRAVLAASIPETAEQVEVEWIRLEQSSNVLPFEVRERLDIQEFSEVAAEVGARDNFADASGYVGWVPQGAFPSVDAVLFGDEERGLEALEVGAISDPIATIDGTFIVHILSAAEEGEITDIMRLELLSQRLLEWQLDQLSTGSKAGWLKINFNSKWYAWVADQLRLSAPRTPRGPR